MSVGGILSRVFRAETFTCAHCRSAALLPHPGLFGGLGAVLGRVRYSCGNCHRTTWLHPGADGPEAPPDAPALDIPDAPGNRVDLAALDVDVVPLRPAPTDLTALDAVLAGSTRRGKRR
jgi:hypothetical protein